MAAKTSYFTDAVVQAMKTLFPAELADSAWDNTGLLLDQADDITTTQGTETVLLTNDLTKAVVDEALQEKASIIVCYHPAIFRGLKSLTNQDPLQASLLRLIASGISLYCPHTAVDAAHGGLNDWLCDILVNGQSEFKSTVVQPIFRPLPEALKGTGYGRSIQLSTPMTLTALLKNLSSGLGNQRYMSVAVPGALNVNEIQDITEIAVCAGSGADVLKDSDAQLLVTGEMVHHEALRHVGLGHVVVTVFHSNSERQYLTQRLKPMLEKELKKIAGGKEGRVVVSTKDRDPFVTMDISRLA